MEVSNKEAGEQHPLATDILHFCAFLNPDYIPAELFKHDDSFKFDTTEFDDAIAALHHYSLIKRNVREHTFSIHRLVQAVLIDAMPPDLQRQWRERVVQALMAAFPKKADISFRNWDQGARLLSNVLTCAAWTDDELTPALGVAVLFSEAGSHLHAGGRYSAAETLLARALMICKQLVGVKHPATANVLISLAYLYDKQDKLSQAEPMYQQALAIQETVFGTDHLNTASSRHVLAYLYMRQGKFEQAEPLLVQALSIQEKHFRAESLDTASSRHDLAVVYFEQGKYEQAEPLLVQALSIQEKRMRAERESLILPQFIAINLIFLAFLYLIQGKFEQAELLFLRVVKRFGEELGAEHPYTNRALLGLAVLQYLQGEHDQAEALLQRALSSSEELYWATFPDIKAIKKACVNILHSIGRDAEAAALGTNEEPLV